MYLSGEGVAQDTKKGRELVEKAVEQGHSQAQYTLGTIYLNGEGVAQDTKKGRELVEKAAEQGDADAQCELGTMYLGDECMAQDTKKGKELVEKAAEQGHSQAQYTLGTMYLCGIVFTRHNVPLHLPDVAQDTKKGRELVEKAVEQGHVGAQFTLGVINLHGKYGVAQDKPKAAGLFEKAAGQGHAEAQSALDGMLESPAQELARAAQTGDITCKTLERLSKTAVLVLEGELDSKGATALHIAAIHGRLNVVEWVVAKGVVGLETADRDGYNCTAFVSAGETYGCD
jgi:TPR repeat protein